MRALRSASFQALLGFCLTLAGPALPAQGLIQTSAVVSPSIPGYVPLTTVEEEVPFAGADTLTDSAVEWDRVFRSFHPKSKLAYNSMLSADAIKRFIQGSPAMIVSAREMTPEESSAFQSKFGYAPTRIPLCIDAVIVFVNKGNPINEISMEDLDAAYSSTRLAGSKNTAETWGDLGARGDWKTRPINAYSREEGAAIRTWFANTVLRKGQYKTSVRPEGDSMALAESVVTDPNGIAYGPLQAWFASVKVIPVSPKSGQPAQPPTQEAVYAGRYPLSRVISLYVNKAPGKPMVPAALELARFLLSREGQTALANTGFIPSPAEFVQMGAKRLN